MKAERHHLVRWYLGRQRVRFAEFLYRIVSGEEMP